MKIIITGGTGTVGKSIIEQNDKFPVKVGKGWNYHQMEDITEKFE